MRPPAVFLALILSVMSTPLLAQWLNHPTPGIPRTADGKPNLTAPAPRTADGKPDLSGLWQRISPKYERNIAADLKPGEIQPWAEALVQQRTEDLQKDQMLLHSPKQRIQRTGTHLESMSAQLFENPLSVDWAFLSVVEDVHLPERQQNLARNLV